MFNLLLIVSVIFTIVELIKEKTEPVAPKGTRFDWDAYWADVNNGISATEQIRKRERGDYLTTKQKQPEWWELPIDTVVDTKRYQHDKEVYGEYMTEVWRKNGSYRCIKK